MRVQALPRGPPAGASWQRPAPTPCPPAPGCAADERLIISFAPNTLAYSILKRIGELFPGPSKVCVRMPWLWAAPGRGRWPFRGMLTCPAAAAASQPLLETRPFFTAPCPFL